MYLPDSAIVRVGHWWYKYIAFSPNIGGCGMCEGRKCEKC